MGRHAMALIQVYSFAGCRRLLDSIVSAIEGHVAVPVLRKSTYEYSLFVSLLTVALSHCYVFH